MNFKVYMHYGIAYPMYDAFSNKRVGASDSTTEGTETLDEAKVRVCELANAHFSGQMGFPDELTWQAWPEAYTKDDSQYRTFGDTIEKQYLRNAYDKGNFCAVCRLSRESSNDGGMAYALLAWRPVDEFEKRLSSQHARLGASYRLREDMSVQMNHLCQTIELHETIISDLVLNEVQRIY